MRLGLFGSVVRGEEKEDSDVDILVEIEKDISLLHFIHLKLPIEDSLGRKVDLVEYKTMKPRLREKILREQIVLLRKETSESIVKMLLRVVQRSRSIRRRFLKNSVVQTLKYRMQWYEDWRFLARRSKLFLKKFETLTPTYPEKKLPGFEMW